MTKRPGDDPNLVEAGNVARLLSYVVVLLGSVYLFIDARELPTSRWEVLGAGAFPQLVFAILIVVSTIAAIGSLRQLNRHTFINFAAAVRWWVGARYLVILVLVLLALYLVLLPVVGFSFSTFGFLLVTQLLLAPRKPKTIAIAILISLAFSFGMDAVFANVFDVFLPPGGF